MNRADLQQMADERVADAMALLAAGRYQAAYYLCGYAIECALKACIAKQIREFDFPDRKLVNDSYVHDLRKLLAVSGIEKDQRAEVDRNTVFAKNWLVVQDWSETSRYNLAISEQMARALIHAVIEPTNGVLPWLKKYY
jgi:HEPN domain-containing protein